MMHSRALRPGGRVAALPGGRTRPCGRVAALRGGRTWPGGCMLAMLLLALAPAAALAQGRIDLQVRSVGFPATVDERFVARDGQWIPIHVEITYNGPAPLQGALHVEAPDLDGDLVSFIEAPVVLTPGAGIRHVWCYAVTPLPVRSPLRVSFIADGARLAAVDVPELAFLPNRYHFVLDISDSTLTGLRAIGLPPAAISDFGVGVQRPFTQEFVVAAMACTSLPDRWFGLESVDTIIWDEADPTRLSEAQLAALRTWVRNGGRLVLGVGGAWSKVRSSPLLELLPFDGDAQTITTRQLPSFQRAAGAAGRGELPRAVQVVVAGRPPDSSRGEVRILAEDLPGAPGATLVGLRFHGSGRVIAVATSIRELLALSPRNFPRKLLDAFPVHGDFLDSEKSSAFQVAMARPASVYAAVVAPTQFQSLGGAFMLGALLFVLAYALVAVGSFTYLKARSLSYLSWTVFAAFAVAGSVVSLAVVGAARGFSRGVRSSGLIDIDMDTPNARGPVWFGYSSPLRQFVDLSLSGEGSYLRPLTQPPPTSGAEASSYATALRYEALPGRALLRDVPLRATLKQFEGYWSGTLGGTIRADLRVDRGTGYLTDASWIRNDLPVPVSHGFLLYLDPRPASVPARAADYEQKDRPRPLSPPADAVLVAKLPALEPGKDARGWMAREYEKLEAALRDWSAKPEGPRPNLTTLHDWQRGWAERELLDVPLSRADPLETLVLCTRALFQPTRKGEFKAFDTSLAINFEGLVNRDVTHWLARGHAVLLLLSPTPAPAVLHRDGQPLPAQGGYTIYRVRVPLHYTGAPQRPGATQPAEPPPAVEEAGENP